LKEIKPPQVVTDVYRDLRDRHLLLPAVALLVGLVAVPFLLKSPAEPAPPAPVATAGGQESELTAAVLADDSVSVRNYRKRLDQLKSKNPFKPQFEPPPPADKTGGSAAAGTDSSAGTVSSAGSTGGTTDTASAGTGTGTYPTATGTASDPSLTGGAVDQGGSGNGGANGNGNGNGNNQPSSDDVEVVNHLVTRRVDVMIGLQGDPKLRENVKPMTILPDPATPVVAYLGTDEKGERAAFVVAKDATLAGGTAACVPAPENCLYITLEKNEKATLDFGPDGQTYDLRLLEIRDVELKAE
jgi:hypothetical protein